jgi:hypothetical protein
MVYDNQNKIKQIIRKHNKATRSMVLGLIRFLRGEFNNSNIKGIDVLSNVSAANSFIPAFVSFGDGGIKQVGMPTTETSTGTIDTIEEALATVTTNKSTFNTVDLQHELVGNIGNIEGANPLYNARCTISRTSYNNGSTDSLILQITALLPKGYYTTNFYQKYSINRHYGTENEIPILLSELGLWASDYNGSDSGVVTGKGNLLARVTFVDSDSTVEDNVATVIKQTSEDVILVNWTIDIASVDDIYSENYMTNVSWEN